MSYMKELTTSTTFKKISPFLFCQAIIWAFIFFGALLTTVTLKYTDFSSSLLPFISLIINGLGLLLGGFIAGRKHKKHGWYKGGLQGIGYVVTLFLISFLAFEKQMSINPMLFGTFAFSISALGGILGVNTK